MPPDRTGAAGPDHKGHAIASTEALERMRVGLYTACLAIALALDIATRAAAEPPAFWICGCGVLVCLIAGYVAKGAAFRAGVFASLVFGFAPPLGLGLASEPPPGSVTLWPQILVALFASRVLAEDCGLRFARLWREPLRHAGPAAPQSAGSAVALGAALTLLFYQGLVWVDPKPAGATGLLAIVVAAFLGHTLVHRTIVALSSSSWPIWPTAPGSMWGTRWPLAG